MTIVVQVTVNGSTWWKKTTAGWLGVEQSEVDVKEPVWVVTDLAEETFTELSVPRIFGPDRNNFILRQLANRFPESVFRIALPPPQTGGLMDRLAPPSQTLTAVEPADRVELALAKIKSPIAGVWSTSMLMARIGQRASMPQHLFVILSQPNGLRILFIKHRVPVLTRLVTSAETAQEKASEVIRTLRHLENTHVVERNTERYGVLLMGGEDEFAKKLAEDRLTLLSLPKKWQNKTIENWSFVLFDQAVKKPSGQLAPIKYRTTYLAKEVSKYASIATGLVVFVAACIATNTVLDSVKQRNHTQQLRQQLAAVSSEMSTVEEAISSYGVSPEEVKKAVEVDKTEIEIAPNMEQHMQQAGVIISQLPQLRLKSWSWRILGEADPICMADGMSTPDTGTSEIESVTTDVQETTSKHKVELKLAIVFPNGMSPTQFEQQTTQISNQLKAWKGSKLIQDPVKDLQKGSISIASAQLAPVAKETVWCVSLSAVDEVKP
jgi:hypothetical protein